MAIFTKGADPEALVTSATRFGDYARTCEEVSAAVGESGSVIRSNWLGNDLLALTGRLPHVQQELAALSHTLRLLGQKLTDNARAQALASGQTLAGGPGGGIPGLPGLPGTPGGPGGNGGPDGLGPALAGLVGSALFHDVKNVYQLLTSPSKLGSALTWLERGKLLSSWEADGGLAANLGRVWKADTVLGKIGQELSIPSNWRNLGAAVPALEEGGSVARALGTAGKVLGPVGAVFNGVTTVSDFANGNYGRGAYDGVMTIASVAACIPIPPINAVGAGVAGAMAVGELVYDHWDDITDFTGDAVDAVGDAAGSVVSALNPFD